MGPQAPPCLLWVSVSQLVLDDLVLKAHPHSISLASHSRMLLNNEILAFLESDSGTLVHWPSHPLRGQPTTMALCQAASGPRAEFSCSSLLPRYGSSPRSVRMGCGGGGSAQILSETKELTCKEFQREPRSPSLSPSPFPVHVSLLSAPRFRERHSLGCVKTTTPRQQGN